MSPEDCEKTAFITHMGLFVWIVMPFSLCNAPAIFMTLMQQILADTLWSKCLIYLDDIIAFGGTFKEPVLNL